MNFLRPHKYWIATLVFAVALMLSSAPLLQLLKDEAAKHLASLQAEHAKAEQSLHLLEANIAESEKLSGQIDAVEIEKSLTPADRLQTVDAIEKQALAARLDHLTYTLSPEQKITINSPGAGAQELALSTITIKADAPLDTDAWAFVERLRAVLPGRLRPQSVVLERIAADTPPAADNLRFTASFEWLSNGAGKEVAEGK